MVALTAAAVEGTDERTVDGAVDGAVDGELRSDLARICVFKRALEFISQAYRPETSLARLPIINNIAYIPWTKHHGGHRHGHP